MRASSEVATPDDVAIAAVAAKMIDNGQHYDKIAFASAVMRACLKDAAK